MRDAVGKATKKEITKEDTLRHQETDQSGKQSVCGAVRSNGSLYPRPETSERSLGSIFAFDGAAPETINGRLLSDSICLQDRNVMQVDVGLRAFFAEKASGYTVMEQLFKPGSTGLVFFIAMVQIVDYASLVPIERGVYRRSKLEPIQCQS